MKERIKKWGRFCDRGIDFLFDVLIVCVLFATLLIDKNIDSRFPNTVRYANGGYYFIAFLLFLLLIGCVQKLDGLLKAEKSFYGILSAIVLLTFIVQTAVVCWLPVNFCSGADFATIRQTAISLEGGGKLTDIDYFYTNPNNINISILLSWVYSIFHSWKAVMLAGAFLTNLSVVLAVLTIYHLTQDKKISMFMAVCGEILIALTWRAYLPYTDNWGMIFVALIFYIYSLRVSNRYKIPLLFLAAAIGSFVKITVWIPFIAVILHSFVRWLQSGKIRISHRKLIAIVLCFCLILGGKKGIEGQLYRYYDKGTSEDAKGWQYFLMLGQNDTYYGVINGEDQDVWIAIKEQYPTHLERMNACLDEALRRIYDRKLLGNIKFYIKKINVAYNDGYFHNVQSATENMENNFWYQLYIKDGRYYHIGADIEQILWDFLLLMMAIGVLRKGDKEKGSYFKVLILGVTAYVMLFENRSKYLYMFLPAYLAYGGLMLHQILQDAVRTEKTIESNEV